MNRTIILLGLLGTAYINAQQKDSLKENKIDEVILNAITKKDTESSNKMPLKFIENPQVYSSVDRTVLENQNLFTIDDAFRNVTGLQKMWNATNRAGDGGSYINLRGFVASNGMRNGMISPISGTMDAVNIEKVEVLKGPSGTIFGSNVTSYGGIVNRVTKKPFEEFQGKITMAGGSYDFFRTQADINVPLNPSKSLLFRINSAFTTEGNFQNRKVKNSYFAFVPSLTWKINDDIDLNIEYENFESRVQAEQNMFFWFSPSLNGNFKDMNDILKAGLDYKQSYVGSGLYNDAKNRNLLGQLNYRISDKIKSTTLVSNSYSFSDGFNPYFYITTSSDKPDGSALGLRRGAQSTWDGKVKYLQIQQNFNFDFNIGNMRNRLLAGADYLRSDNNVYFLSGTIDFVPFSGADYSHFNGDAVQEFYNNGNYGSYPMVFKKDTYSAYISNVLSITDALKAMASVRYESNDFKGGNMGADVAPYKQAAFSPKFGLVYEIFKDKFSAFGNYQNSFRSNGYYMSDANGTNTLSTPETANQWEAGFKTNLLKGRLNATVSYYDIKVKNTLQTIGYTSGNLAIKDQMGQLESKGVELEMNAYLVKGFSVIAGVSYNDSKFTQTSDASVLGRRPNTASSPWLMNFNANYQFLDGSLEGLGFGIGGNYASANRIFNTTTSVFELPKYLVLNANAFYDTKKFRIGVNVDNFTNEKYWFGYTTANPQKLMTAVGSFTYKF